MGSKQGENATCARSAMRRLQAAARKAHAAPFRAGRARPVAGGSELQIAGARRIPVLAWMRESVDKKQALPVFSARSNTGVTPEYNDERRII